MPEFVSGQTGTGKLSSTAGSDPRIRMSPAMLTSSTLGLVLDTGVNSQKLILHLRDQDNSMERMTDNWCVIIPMANEEQEFQPLISKLSGILDRLGSGRVYMIVDTVSVDDTLGMCERISREDERFITVWSSGW